MFFRKLCQIIFNYDDSREDSYFSMQAFPHKVHIVFLFYELSLSPEQLVIRHLLDSLLIISIANPDEFRKIPSTFKIATPVLHFAHITNFILIKVSATRENNTLECQILAT